MIHWAEFQNARHWPHFLIHVPLCLFCSVYCPSPPTRTWTPWTESGLATMDLGERPSHLDRLAVRSPMGSRLWKHQAQQLQVALRQLPLNWEPCTLQTVLQSPAGRRAQHSAHFSPTGRSFWAFAELLDHAVPTGDGSHLGLAEFHRHLFRRAFAI